MEIFLVAIFGLVFGSFLNVVIVRVPNNQSIITPPSTCQKCGNRLKFYHNIPILSYLFLKGKCGFCGEKISIIYPIVELLNMLIFIMIFLKFGMSFEFIKYITIFSLLLSLSMIDIKYKAVPDSINLLALTISLIGINAQSTVDFLTSALIMAGVFSFLRFYVSYFVKREAMGDGDIIVAGTIGGVVGVELSFVAIFISALLTIPISLINQKRGDVETPFIPFLALGLFLTLLFDKNILKLLEHLR